jgi:probable HAF family extracellular repeat protein
MTSWDGWDRMIDRLWAPCRSARHRPNLRGRLAAEALEARCLLSYTLTDLGDFPVTGSSEAHAINATGTVVGYAAVTEEVTRAVLWNDGMMTDLGTLGGLNSFAHGINDQAQVVGESAYHSGKNSVHAFLWQNGVMTDLNRLLAHGSGWTLTSATAISHDGRIVGTGTTPDGLMHAYLLTPDPPATAADRFRIDVPFAQASGQPRAIGATIAAPAPVLRTDPLPIMRVGQRAESRATPAPAPLIGAPHAPDAGWESGGSPVGEVLALNLFGSAPRT